MSLGVESDPQEGMLLFDDMNIVEIENGVMYLSCLYNFVQPLIRYRLSDHLNLQAPTENSRYPFTRAVGLLGRNEDILWFKDGNGKREFLHPLAIEGFCIEGLRDYQFMQALLVLMYALVIVFILIVTVMTGSKILLAEQKDLGIYKAIGFSSTSLRLTFALRFAIVAVLGGFFGTLLAAVITDPIVSSVMKLAGISNFTSHPNFIDLVLPMVVVTLLFAFFGGLIAEKIKKVPLTVLAAD